MPLGLLFPVHFSRFCRRSIKPAQPRYFLSSSGSSHFNELCYGHVNQLCSLSGSNCRPLNVTSRHTALSLWSDCHSNATLDMPQGLHIKFCYLTSTLIRSPQFPQHLPLTPHADVTLRSSRARSSTIRPQASIMWGCQSCVRSRCGATARSANQGSR